MIKKLICAITAHNWETLPEKKEFYIEEQCKRCGKQRERFDNITFMSRHFANVAVFFILWLTGRREEADKYINDWLSKIKEVKNDNM